jgi:hypothetical protein
MCAALREESRKIAISHNGNIGTTWLGTTWRKENADFNAGGLNGYVGSMRQTFESGGPAAIVAALREIV